jgi:hypothetical protein
MQAELATIENQLGIDTISCEQAAVVHNNLMLRVHAGTHRVKDKVYQFAMESDYSLLTNSQKKQELRKIDSDIAQERQNLQTLRAGVTSANHANRSGSRSGVIDLTGDDDIRIKLETAAKVRHRSRF